MSINAAEAARAGAVVPKPRRRTMKFWATIATFGGLIASVGIVVLALDSASNGREFDKSQTAGDAVVGYGTLRDVGHVFTDATAFVTLKHGPVTLRTVDFQIQGSTVRQLGPPMVALIKPEAFAYVDVSPGYPPSQAQIDEYKWGAPVPAEGAVLTVPAGQSQADYVILIGLEITGAGRSFRTEPDIVYQVPGRWWESKIHVNVSLAICSPQTGNDIEDCE